MESCWVHWTVFHFDMLRRAAKVDKLDKNITSAVRHPKRTVILSYGIPSCEVEILDIFLKYCNNFSKGTRACSILVEMVNPSIAAY